MSKRLTSLSKNCSGLNLARHGHREHAPLTVRPDCPAGEVERRLLDTLERDDCWPWRFEDLLKLFPASHPSWHERHGERADAAYLLHYLKALQVVGEVAYDKRSRRWRRTP